jgi:DNA repair protein RecN (Recombination protein N)
LDDGELDGGGLVLRRILNADGRSRAFINDQPVSVSLMRRVGEALVEVNGQFEAHGLLNPATHAALLDAHGGLAAKLARVAGAHADWRRAQEAHGLARGELERARNDEEYVRHALGELSEIDPRPGEEAELAAKRTAMMHGEQFIEALNGALAELTGGRGMDASLRSALQRLAQVADKAEGLFDPAIEALERSLLETGEALAQIQRAADTIDLDPARLGETEERLFALRALARKHGTDVDGLGPVRDGLQAQCDALSDDGAALDRLAGEEAKARGAYEKAAGALSTARRAAAKRLDAAVGKELPPLKLGEAVLQTRLIPLDENAWNESGMERVAFEVRTNPDTPMGPLGKVASGGELARILLALKVALADAAPVSSIVFDEVDAGLSGAAAAAVGDRLSLLSERHQVLVVTHSPQVAARAQAHWRVSKAAHQGATRTRVEALDDASRREEVARMLAGKRITDEARAAADSLLDGGQP